MPTLYNFKVRNIEGRLLNLADFEGKVVIIVSVASKCGFTDQYIGLEELCNNYKKDGLVIIGFPCDQFGSQGPGTNKEIQEFCTLNYNVSFPMAAKINVNGKRELPLYSWLKKSQSKDQR